MTTQATAITALAQTLSEDPERIQAMDPRWLNLLQDGVIITLTLRRWRGKTSLSLEDLGIPFNGEEEVYREILDLGDKLLLPREIIKELDSIDSAARKAVERYGFRTHWGAFIPSTAYQAWKEENARYQVRYDAIRDRIVAQHQSIVEQLLDEYTTAARIAFRRRQRLNVDQDHRYLPEDTFVDHFVQHVRSLIPTAKQIHDSFAYEVHLSFVPLPSLLAADEARADQIRLEALKNRAALSAEEERQRFTTQMHREVLDKARREKETLINGFLQDIVGQLRALIYDAVVTIAESMQRNGYLHPRSVAQIKGLTDQISRLNFFGDTDADRMIAQLQAITIRSTNDRSVEEIQAQLRAIATVTRSTLIALGQQPRSARALGLTDTPTPELVRTARRQLGLAELQPAGARSQRQLN